MSQVGTVLFSGVRHAASYLPLLLAQPEVKLLGLCEEQTAPDWARADTLQLCKTFDLPFLGDPSEALSREEVQLVIICSEPVRHARLALQALHANRHVLVDKPLATTLQDAVKVLEAARNSSGKSSVVHRLYAPPIQRARRLIDSSHLGLIQSADLEFLADGAQFGTSVERPELVADPALSGGGELTNFLMYPVDYLRYLTGLEVVEVYAEAGSFFFEAHRRYGVEDLGVLSLKLEHNVIATLTVGRVPHAPSVSPLTSSLRLIGADGYLCVEEDQPHLEVWNNQPRQRFQPVGGESGQIALSTLLNQFIQDIVQDRAPLYKMEDAWAAVAVTDAAYRSLASGQPEAVKPFPQKLSQEAPNE